MTLVNRDRERSVAKLHLLGGNITPGCATGSDGGPRGQGGWWLEGVASFPEVAVGLSAPGPAQDTVI